MTLEKLPIKKDFLLIAGTVLLLIAGYRFAFRNTIEAWQLNKRLNAKLSVAGDPSAQPGYLIRKNVNLSKILSLYRADTTGYRSNAINDIAQIAQKEGVKLSEVPTADPAYRTDAYIIQKVELDGDYFAMEKVLNTLSSTTRLGVVRSVKYQLRKSKNGNGGVKHLTLEIYMEMLNK